MTSTPDKTGSDIDETLGVQADPSGVSLSTGTGIAIVEPNGARVAELRMRSDLPNLLWAHQLSGGVMGGDRLWPAPEVDLFYSNTSDATSWRCPPDLDPGSWELRRMTWGIHLFQTALGARFDRFIQALEPPATSRMQPWVGYRAVDRVVSDRGWTPWHIVPVPSPVNVYLNNTTSPVPYYGQLPDVIGGWITALDPDPRWKVGFPPPPNGVVLICAVDHKDPGGMVSVLSHATPGKYLDVPLGGHSGTAVQVYNSGGHGYCEVEHHAPLGQSVLESMVVGHWGSRTYRSQILDQMSSADGIELKSLFSGNPEQRQAMNNEIHFEQ